MFKDLTLQEFVNKTASNEPTPGGGSIAATNGAIAYSLTQMVANLTVGKEKFASVEQEMQDVIQKSEELRQELLLDIDRDASSFDEVMKAFKMPKSTDEEKKARSAKIQEGYKYAASVPLGVAKKIVESMNLIEFVIKNGNKNAVTDGLVAMMNARTGALAALLNVRINLGSIKDQDFVQEYTKEIKELERIAVTKETVMLNTTEI